MVAFRGRSQTSISGVLLGLLVHLKKWPEVSRTLISDERNATRYMHDSFDSAVPSKHSSVTRWAKYVRSWRNVIRLEETEEWPHHQVHSNQFPASILLPACMFPLKHKWLIRKDVLWAWAAYTDHTEDTIYSWVGLQFLSLQQKKNDFYWYWGWTNVKRWCNY